MAYIGLDVGTTGVKATVITAEGVGVASAYGEYNLRFPRPGWVEMRPSDVWAAVKRVLGMVCAATDEKIEAIAKRVYHADGVVFEPAAQKEIAQLEALGFGEMPVCMAKTQYSFSDDATKLGAPRDFQITVRQVKVSAGAGFIVALTGSIMTMPGLGKAPAAHKIDVMEDGTITGLF